ncbi:MAG: MFS transporter [Rickettsiaceae bacterium]
MDKRSFLIAGFSAFVQYYDYHLFGLLASKISQEFIPSTNQATQLTYTYLILAISFIAKPIGAIILGRIGDIKGRSNSFTISLLGTAIASLIISLTPGYKLFGIFSIFILIIMRMITCAMISPGVDGVRLYIYENIAKQRQCFGVALSSIFMQMGSMIAAVSAAFFTLDIFPEFAWRGSFTLGALMGTILVLIKLKYNIADIINIKTTKQYGKYSNASIVSIIGNHLKIFILSAVICGSIGSMHQFLIIFFGTYNFAILKSLDQPTMQSYTAFAIAIYMIFSIISGLVGDIINRYQLVLWAIIALIIVNIYMMFWIKQHMQLNIFIFFLSSAILAFITIPSAVIIKESIPIETRYRIFSIAHAFGSILISAPTNFFAAKLYYTTQLTWAPILYFIIINLIMFIAVKMLISTQAKLSKT